MINVAEALKAVPCFKTFCSVRELHALVEALRANSSNAKVEVAGASENGVPIHHVRFGKGSTKALVVAFPHCMEPIGGLTVFSLMTLLHQRNPALINSDVEWHIVPCIDPDGAMLNEQWTQVPFTLQNHMRNYYLQAPQRQVDASFPISYKGLSWSRPSIEAGILKKLLDKIRPDFYFSLHNTRIGGAGYFISRDIGHKYYRQFHELAKHNGLSITKKLLWKEICAQFGDGILEMITLRKIYDYLQKTMSSPESLLKFGAYSWEYLAEIKPEALSLVAELGYARHPRHESDAQTGRNLKQFKLRIDADTKFLASVLLEESERVREDLDPTSPFYKSMVEYALPTKDSIWEGGWPLSRYPTREILFNPQYDRPMTEGEQFDACMIDGGLWSLYPLWSYQFLRLLETSKQTSAVKQAMERLGAAFERTLADMGEYVDFSAFEVFDCTSLAKVQLGSGLIALNSVLEAERRAI